MGCPCHLLWDCSVIDYGMAMSFIMGWICHLLLDGSVIDYGIPPTVIAYCCILSEGDVNSILYHDQRWLICDTK